jgi:acyl-homoserine-lactone acylase
VRSIGLWLALAGVLAATPALAANGDAVRWKAEAARVTIVRDDWGIAHVHGRSDADAVFGMVYAQAEDDFHRIEINYLANLGRMSEAEGDKFIAQDLRARLYVDPEDLKARYAKAPASLRALMDAWADGLNYFLASHPNVKPEALKHFEPWMALAFSEGSIGGDIERIDLGKLADFYSMKHVASLELAQAERLSAPTGSNGIAIAPANTVDHHALLLINPHTSYYFRSELQMTSDAGLNAYGAATWGQFFIYQGFNPRLGWMHTSTTSNAVDQYLETIIHVKRALHPSHSKAFDEARQNLAKNLDQDEKLYYRYGGALRPVRSSLVSIQSRTPDGRYVIHLFTIYKTHHGPIVAKAGDKWVAESMMFNPVAALEQGFGLTKAKTYAAYMKVMELKANTSNNTVYADADGNIAYLHPQFIPRRDDRFDYQQPVDGSDPNTDWKGVHALSEAPHLLNPKVGWIQNTNNGPYSAAGPDSPKATDYPHYMDEAGQNMRGLHAIALLTDRHDFTLERLQTAAFDPNLPGFKILIPALLKAYDATSDADPTKMAVAEQVAALRAWDERWGLESVPTSLAVYWGEALWQAAGKKLGATTADYDDILAHTTDAQKLAALQAASAKLTADFGTWRTPWGEINRFQRRTDDLVQQYSDTAPSLPVAFTSSQWGSLASISGRKTPELKRRYGDNGNSFVAMIEFGPRIHAIAVTAGGESGDPASKHFTDQAVRHTTGNLREVYFYPDQLKGHTGLTYHPGQL